MQTRLCYYICIFWTIALISTACFEDNSLEEEPKAYLRVIHNNSQLPDLEILSDGEQVGRVNNGDISGVINLALGSHEIKVRNTGASQALDMSITFDMKKQYYLVAVSGTFQEPTLIGYDKKLPKLEEGVHWLGLLDITRALEPAVLYRESDKLFELPIDDHVGDYTELAVSNGSETLSVILNNGGATCNPPLTENFRERDASVILIRELVDDQDTECVMERINVSVTDE